MGHQILVNRQSTCTGPRDNQLCSAKGRTVPTSTTREGTMLAAGREHPVLDTIDLKPALRLALALERAPMGLIMLQDELSGHLYPALSQGLTPQQCTQFGVHRPGVGPVGLAFSQRERVT